MRYKGSELEAMMNHAWRALLLIEAERQATWTAFLETAPADLKKSTSHRMDGLFVSKPRVSGAPEIASWSNAYFTATQAILTTLDKVDCEDIDYMYSCKLKLKLAMVERLTDYKNFMVWTGQDNKEITKQLSDLIVSGRDPSAEDRCHCGHRHC